MKNKKNTFRQNRRACEAAQENEKLDFLALAWDLCSGVPEIPQSKGRPSLPIQDIVFSMLLKVFCGMSCRRTMSDLKIARKLGLISKLPSSKSIFRYFGLTDLRSRLVDLITESSVVVKHLETGFAIDSTGFSTSSRGLWVDLRYGRSKTTKKRKWIKAHLMCGVLTNIVTAAEVSPANAGDSPYLRDLVDMTARNFEIKEVYCDKAYSSLDNLKHIRSQGAIPFIPFKVNANPVHGTGDPLWAWLFHLYAGNKEWFGSHYHKRSNSESTNSMIKAKFGERIRSRSESAQYNELLCKIVCHNVCVTIQSMYELGIFPKFWESEKKAA